MFYFHLETMSFHSSFSDLRYLFVTTLPFKPAKGSLTMTKEEEAAIKEVEEKAKGTEFTEDLIRLGIKSEVQDRVTRICQLWGNSKWILQAPTGRFSPVSLQAGNVNLLMEMASMTQIQEDEARPNGFPASVMKALDQAISLHISKRAGGQQVYDWHQAPTLTLAIELLKKGLAKPSDMESTIPATCTQPSRSSSFLPERQHPPTPESSNLTQLQPDPLSVALRRFKAFQPSFQESISEAGVSQESEAKISNHLEQIERLLKEGK